MATLIESRPFGLSGSHHGKIFGSTIIVTTFRHVLRFLSTHYRAMHERARLRRNMMHMSNLDDHILRDIGLERSQLSATVRNCPPRRRRDDA